MREILERQAKARMQEHGGTAPGRKSPVPNLVQAVDESGRVSHQLAREAGVSHNTYEALATVANSGVPELQQAVREKKVGASTAALDSAADWIDRNQLGRRNLSADQMSILRGRVYNRRKKDAHRPNNVDKMSALPERTSEALAHEFGVNEKTIRRDGQYAAAVDKLNLAAAVATGLDCGSRSAGRA